MNTTIFQPFCDTSLFIKSLLDYLREERFIISFRRITFNSNSAFLFDAIKEVKKEGRKGKLFASSCCLRRSLGIIADLLYWNFCHKTNLYDLLNCFKRKSTMEAIKWAINVIFCITGSRVIDCQRDQRGYLKDPLFPEYLRHRYAKHSSCRSV